MMGLLFGGLRLGFIRVLARRFRGLFVAAMGVCLFGLVACSGDVEAPQVSPSGVTNLPGEPVDQDGPHAPADREVAPRTVAENAAGTATITDVDFGNVTLGGFSAPARGVIVAPKRADAPMPLVVVSHLRAPNCADGSFAYPCAEGVAENRFDRGMTYLGEHLAEHGYAVLIPDFGGVFVGTDVHEPYDQDAMWRDVVGAFVGALQGEGVTDAQDFGLPQPVDFGSVGLVLHSRSAAAVSPAIALFGEHAIKSVFAYGPAYDTFDLEYISPAPADVPYLAVMGEADADVGASANRWLGHYVSQPRTSPALAAAIPGFGHMLINRVASENRTDDRIGCDVRACPDAAEHERVVSALSLGWLDATLRGLPSDLPVRSEQPLPNMIVDVPVRWLAATPNAIAHVTAQDFASAGGVDVCVHADPMVPTPVANACPEPERGVVDVATEVFHFRDASVDVDVSGARGVALHVLPAGSVDAAGTPLQVVLRTEGGGEFVYEVDANDPALANRSSDEENGTYTLGTIRVALPEWVSNDVVTNIHLIARGAPVELRGVDFW